jgi:hypothetical protein
VASLGATTESWDMCMGKSISSDSANSAAGERLAKLNLLVVTPYAD